ncbi:hybrid sensor histidine kinase/response regulator [Pseudorhodoferax soli]|uniref:histidine kinase n=1 Tax=Pseudorhodoferax soli TaxID=545864 RepID=A0A368XFE1_9BURK|nr:PAS domain-containing sensor histidine kinase [Pseudorhodoferax soli]RCW66692.1 PAS domain S-box-containing protein [Pseudorhodoferax soli]
MNSLAAPSLQLSELGEDMRYRLLVDAVTDYAIYMLDPEGRVVSWNPGAQRLKGYTPAQILGQSFSSFYTEDDRLAGLPARALVTAATQGRFEAEGWRVRKDGSRFWALVVIEPIRGDDGGIVGYAKVTRDLTERRAAEESLRRSEEQFRVLVQGVTDYAIYMLDPQGLVANWNAGAQRIKGYAAAEVVGTHFSRFYRAEDRARDEPGHALATAAREGRFEAEGWRVRKDGSEFRANVVIDAIRDDDGRIVGFAKITRDVTAQRAAQQALERAREALFQSQKLDAIGQLTGGVAHDFNNLLMVVMSSLSLVRRRLPDDPKLVQLIDNALNGARRGAALTQRMLAFARRQDLKPTVVRLPALVEGMAELLTRTLGSTVQVQTAFAPALPPVLVDANQLELALLNLAVNARDAMPEGGQLTLSAQEETLAQSGAIAPGHYVRLAVTDTGSGMDAATLARATEPFFTTKGAGKGTGLGLAMVHGLAGQSGGGFTLQSQAGQGTTATLWLPVADDDTPAAAPARAAVASPAVAAMRVLAVDDDPLVLTNTVALLEELGHSVLQTATAEEALRLLRADATIALLVSDHVMPHMTGAQLIAKVRQERPQLPVVLATGYAELPAGLPPRTVRLGKPFDQAGLALAIADALADR